jgi:predicted PurR-regulated permease PerM
LKCPVLNEEEALTSTDALPMNEPASTSGAATTPSADGAPPGGLPSTHKAVVVAARLVSFSLLCGLLYWGKAVAIPLALAVLVSFMLNPLVKLVQRTRLPRTGAVILTVLLAGTAVAALTWVIGMQVISLSEKLPEYREIITAKVKDLQGAMRGGAVGKIQDTMSTVAHELEEPAAAQKIPPGEEPAVPVPAPGSEIAEKAGPILGEQEKPIPVYLTSPQRLVVFERLSALLPVIDPLTTAGLVMILVVLLLLRWDDMRNRLISFSGHKNLTVATKACDAAGRRITRYLIMLFIVNSSYGAAIGVGLFFLGVDYAALWGLCAALFRFVPYAGPIAAALLPTAFSLISSVGWQQPLWVVAMIVCLELVSNNIVEPWLYGANLGLSAMGIIIAAVAWTFLWGPVGLVLSTPLIVILVVLGEYVPAFSIFCRVLGDKPVMEPHFQFYQRLLVRDETGATQLAREFVKENGLRESLDLLFVPALALARRDDTAGLLEAADAAFVSSNAELVFELFRKDAEDADKKSREEKKAPKEKEVTEDKQAPEDKKVPEDAQPEGALLRVPVIVWPVNELAVTAGKFFQWMLRGSAADIIMMSPNSLAGEVTQEIRTRMPAAVCVMSFAGADVARTRQYTRRLHSDSRGVPLVVARLGGEGTMATDMRESLRDAGATAVPGTLQETATAMLPYANDAAQSAASQLLQAP